MESQGKIRTGLTAIALAALPFAHGACASSPGGEGGGNEPITIQVDNMTNRVVTVERVVASGAATQPVTVRVGLVRGETQQTLTIPWHPSRMAHQLLWFDGLNSPNYRVEECTGQGTTDCAETRVLHLPPGAEVSLVIDTRLEVTMYYQLPSGSG